MAIHSIGLAVGLTEARNQGIPDSEAARIGVVASLLGTPVVSLVVARSMARRRAAELAAAAPVLGGDDTPPSDPDKNPVEIAKQALATAGEARSEAAAAKADAARALCAVEELADKIEPRPDGAEAKGGRRKAASE